jgi:predicted phage tail protein
MSAALMIFGGCLVLAGIVGILAWMKHQDSKQRSDNG